MRECQSPVGGLAPTGSPQLFKRAITAPPPLLPSQLTGKLNTANRLGISGTATANAPSVTAPTVTIPPVEVDTTGPSATTTTTTTTPAQGA